MTETRASNEVRGLQGAFADVLGGSSLSNCAKHFMEQICKRVLTGKHAVEHVQERLQHARRVLTEASLHGPGGVPEPAVRQLGKVLTASLTYSVCGTKRRTTTPTSKQTKAKQRTRTNQLCVVRSKKKSCF